MVKPLGGSTLNRQVRHSCRTLQKIALGKGVVIPDEAKANSASMAAWIELEQRHEAPQERSQDRLQAGGINFTSIDVAGDEISETQD